MQYYAWYTGCIIHIRTYVCTDYYIQTTYIRTYIHTYVLSMYIYTYYIIRILYVHMYCLCTYYIIHILYVHVCVVYVHTTSFTYVCTDLLSTAPGPQCDSYYCWNNGTCGSNGTCECKDPYFGRYCRMTPCELYMYYICWYR